MIDLHVLGLDASGFRMPFQDNYYLWKVIGFTGIATFGSRFVVQWLYSEKHKESKVPPIFWWQSMVGTLLCLAYALRQKESVFIAGYVFNMVPYTRNLMLIRRKKHENSGGFPVIPPVAGTGPTPSTAPSQPLTHKA